MEKYAAHWNPQVACGACHTMKLKKLNKKEEIPLTEDLEKLKQHVEKCIQTEMRNKRPSFQEYCHFTQLVITRIAVFNKRRIAEVDELTVQDFNNRIRGEEANGNATIMESLTVAEKALCNRYNYVYTLHHHHIAPAVINIMNVLKSPQDIYEYL